MHRSILAGFVLWLSSAALATVFSLLAYAGIQQVHRTMANDPQIQIAEDASIALASGVPVSNVVPALNTDLGKSLAPFIIVYGPDKKAVAASGKLGADIPTPPTGVFDNAKAQGENRLSWQPEKSLRVAAVVRYFEGKQSGYVLVGRSLREIEAREQRLTFMVLMAWLVSLVISLVLSFIYVRVSTSKPRPEGQ